MVIEYTLDVFEQNNNISEIILVVDSLKDVYFTKLQKTYSKISRVILGGKTRGLSIINAANALQEDEDCFVVIHDACRPFLDPEIIQKGIHLLKQKEFVKTVLSPQDDIMFSKKEIIDRSQYVILSSPDFLSLSFLRKLVQHNLYGLSCVFSAALKFNPDIHFEYILSNRKNMKITFPEDIKTAEFYLLSQS